MQDELLQEENEEKDLISLPIDVEEDDVPVTDDVVGDVPIVAPDEDDDEIEMDLDEEQGY